MGLDSAEKIIRAVGAVAALGTLAIAVLAMLRSLRQPPSVEEGGAHHLLRPWLLLLATAAFVGAGALLWFPIPMDVEPWLRTVLLVVSSLLLFGGLALYLIGLRSLGAMFAPSSGFGVRLQRPRQLVTTGPYAYVRHPMYLAVIASSFGILLLHRTWAGVFLAVTMLGLVVRARREERVLANTCGQEWEAYAARVPAWVPRVHSRDAGT